MATEIVVIEESTEIVAINDTVEVIPVSDSTEVIPIFNEPGTPGDSAYEIAVANGFVGTEAEWLSSLEGSSYVPDPAAEPDDRYLKTQAGALVYTDAAVAVHNHDTAYVNEVDHTKGQHDAMGIVPGAHSHVDADIPTGIARDAEVAASLASSIGFIDHGADANIARPTTHGRYVWYGTVQPVNMANLDEWEDTT